MTVDGMARGRLVSRRAFLGVVGLGGLAVSLGACGGSGDDGPGETPTPIPNGEFMFESDGLRIHYTVEGAGPPLVLLHGWASQFRETWVDTGFVEALSSIRTIIGPDQRGHGASDKPHDAAAYSTTIMAADIVRLLDHLEIERADVFGYSMGGGVTVGLLATAPERISAAVMGGVGSNVIAGEPNETTEQLFSLMRDALLAEETSALSPPLKAVRDLYASQGQDLVALAGWLGAEHVGATREQLAALTMPVLVANAEGDKGGDVIAAAIPGGQFESIPGTNHLSVLPDERYHARVVRFLREVDAG
jgi:pimeloyl-ACP methyl ester carboxylesterase